MPPLLFSFLQAEFEEGKTSDNGEGEAEEAAEVETDEELTERTENLQAQLDAMQGRAKGKADLKRALAESQRKLALRTLKGQFEYLRQNEKLLARYRESWLAEKAAEELDYPIFFAVSEKAGKDNSGDPIYKKDENGELALDHHGHLMLTTTLIRLPKSLSLLPKNKALIFGQKNNHGFYNYRSF